jgi:hypothetical protein
MNMLHCAIVALYYGAVASVHAPKAPPWAMFQRLVGQPSCRESDEVGLDVGHKVLEHNRCGYGVVACKALQRRLVQLDGL